MNIGTKTLFTHLNELYSQRRLLSYKRLLTWYSGLVRPKPNSPPYKHLVQIGDPRLRATSKPVPLEEIDSERIQQLIGQMRYIFRNFNCMGLSATQIGMPLRIFLMEVNRKVLKEFTPKEQEIKEITLVEPTVVINPEIKITDFKKVVFNESCGSIKGFCADVPRYYALQLNGFNEYAEPFTINASGFTARIIQHEMDHLDGKLYTDIMDRTTLSSACWEIVNQRSGKVELPYGPY